jgi:uncharacterized protein YqjF (DUF2071 family)
MKKNNWIIQQTWQHLVFLHYAVSGKELQKLTPFPLDLFDGEAILSIVPFYMTDIRFPYTPKMPLVGKLWELNLRTYVNVGGIKGIYFFTLETDNWLSEKIARYFFHLPYHYSQIEASVQKQKYQIKHQRKNLSFELQGTIGDVKEKTDFDLWSAERYHLFCRDENQVYRGDTIHPAWSLKNFEATLIKDQFSCLLGNDQIPSLSVGNLLSASYSEKLEVKFQPFVKLNLT